MSLTDSRGRLFGGMNVVDLLVGLAIIIAVPIAYAAYTLWRTPEPALTDVVPRTVQQGPAAQVEIHGKRLRPYMRLSFGDHQGPAFYFISPNVAVVPMPELAPGVYDLILYDYSREVARLPKALTVSAPPPPRTVTMTAVGAFVEIAESTVPLITPGLAFASQAGVVRTVSAPVPAVARIQTNSGAAITLPVSQGIELPASIDLNCRLDVTADGAQRCLLGDDVVTPGAVVTLPQFTAARFRIDELRAPAAAK